MKNSTVLVVIGAILIFFTICIKLRFQTEIIHNSPTRVNSYKKWLEYEEKALWDEVATATNLTYDTCQALKKEWYKDYAMGEAELHVQDTSNKTISPATYQLVDSILQDFGLSVASVPLLAWKQNSVAAGTDTKMFINERLFCKLPPEAQKFVIGHEAQHILYKDTSTRYVIERFCTISKDLPQNHPINKLNRFHELRADIESACKSDEYARGYKTYIQMIAQKGINAGITHPKHTIRLATAEKILNSTVAT